MVRYWKLVGVVLAVAVLAVVMVAAVPAVGNPNEPQLFTLLDGVTVPAENPLTVPIFGDYVDVTKFSEFKVFSRVTTASTTSGPDIRFALRESMDGEVDMDGATTTYTHGLDIAQGPPPVDIAHPLPFPNSGPKPPFRYLRVRVYRNNSPDTHTLSVFLYAVP